MGAQAVFAQGKSDVRGDSTESTFGSPAAMSLGRILCRLSFVLAVVDATCTDEPNWTDSQNDGCSVYVSSSWCTSDGQEGPAWNATLGNISSFADDNGTDAFQVCCACGGGVTIPSPSPAPSPFMSPSPSPSPNPVPSPQSNGSLQGRLGLSVVNLVTFAALAHFLLFQKK